MLDVSASGYRSWKRGSTPDRKRQTDAQILTLIRAIDAELKGSYGSLRMVLELRDRGFSAATERVERLMRENGIRARHKRRYKVTTDFEVRIAGGREPAGSELHHRGTESCLDLGHHLPVEE